jgi:hypothetical protein
MEKTKSATDTYTNPPNKEQQATTTYPLILFHKVALSLTARFFRSVLQGTSVSNLILRQLGNALLGLLQLALHLFLLGELSFHVFPDLLTTRK